MPRVLGRSYGGGRFLVSEVPLYSLVGSGRRWSHCNGSNVIGMTLEPLAVYARRGVWCWMAISWSFQVGGSAMSSEKCRIIAHT